MAIPQRSYKPGSDIDNCYTPPEATRLIVPYLKRAGVQTIWEPACGNCLMVSALRQSGFNVVGTDIQDGSDFLAYTPDFEFDAIVTNPPFSLDYKFIERCVSWNVPFALLMKTDREGVERCRNAGMFDTNGLPLYEKLIPSARIAYKMPQKGWESSPQFHTSWYCWDLNTGSSMKVVPYKQEPR